MSAPLTPYEEIMAQLDKQQQLGPDYELREVKRWNVHCKHCGIQLVGDTPQTDKAFQAIKNLLPLKCRNTNCISNGGTERRRDK